MMTGVSNFLLPIQVVHLWAGARSYRIKRMHPLQPNGQDETVLLVLFFIIRCMTRQLERGKYNESKLYNCWYAYVINKTNR